VSVTDRQTDFIVANGVLQQPKVFFFLAHTVFIRPPDVGREALSFTHELSFFLFINPPCIG